VFSRCNVWVLRQYGIDVCLCFRIVCVRYAVVLWVCGNLRLWCFRSLGVFVLFWCVSLVIFSVFGDLAFCLVG